VVENSNWIKRPHGLAVHVQIVRLNEQDQPAG
jgi:hypothetical protein